MDEARTRWGRDPAVGLRGRHGDTRELANVAPRMGRIMVALARKNGAVPTAEEGFCSGCPWSGGRTDRGKGLGMCRETIVPIAVRKFGGWIT